MQWKVLEADLAMFKDGRERGFGKSREIIQKGRASFRAIRPEVIHCDGQPCPSLDATLYIQCWCSHFELIFNVRSSFVEIECCPDSAAVSSYRTG